MGKVGRKRESGRRKSRTGPLLPSQVQQSSVASSPLVRRMRSRRGTARGKGAPPKSLVAPHDDSSDTHAEADEDYAPVPILIKLDSASVEDRESACYAVATIVTDQPAVVQELMQGGLLPKLSVCFVHPQSVTLRTAAANALRSICLAQPAISSLLLSTNSLGVIFNGAHHAAISMRENSDSEIRAQYDAYLIQVISVLWALLEESQEAVNMFNASNCLETLLLCLHPDICSLDLISVSAQCLYIVTDENPHITKILGAAPANLVALKFLLSDQHANTYLRIVGAGILNNIATETTSVEILQATLPVLCTILDYDPNADLLSIIPELASNYAAYTEAKQNESFDIGAFDPPVSFHQWHERAKSLQLSLEILANIFVSWAGDEDIEEEDADSEDWASGAESSKDEGAGQGDAQGSLVAGATVKHLKEIGCFQKIFQKTLFPPAAVLTIVREAATLPQLEVVFNIQSRSLACIGNAAQGLVTTADEFSLLWNHLSGLLSQGIQFNEREHALVIVESTTSLLWQLSKHDFASNVLSASDLRPLAEEVFKILRNTDCTDEIRTNLVGVLGPLALHSKNLTLIEAATKMLFDHCNSALAVIISAEALNSLMDIFGDVFFDKVFYALNAPALLTTYQPSFKSQVKQQRKSYPRDIRDRLDETVVNLRRFIDYKRTHK